MVESDPKLARLLDNVDKAKAGVDRLVKEAIAKPKDKEQSLSEAIEHEARARRLAAKFSGD